MDAAERRKAQETHLKLRPPPSPEQLRTSTSGMWQHDVELLTLGLMANLAQVPKLWWPGPQLVGAGSSNEAFLKLSPKKRIAKGVDSAHKSQA